MRQVQRPNRSIKSALVVFTYRDGGSPLVYRWKFMSLTRVPSLCRLIA
jgi:hypothetical protein